MSGERRVKIDERTEITITRLPPETSGCLIVIVAGLVVAAASVALAMF